MATNVGNGSDEDDDGAGRACDSCRLKKIKCDKKDVCGSCALRKIACLRTMPDARKRKRGHAEEAKDDLRSKLDQMQIQLDAISSLLQQQNSLQTIQTIQPAPTRTGSACGFTPSSTASTSLTTPSPDAAVMDSAGIPLAGAGLNALVTNIKGQLQYLGKSSLLSMSIEAQLLTTELHDSGQKKEMTAQEAENCSILQANQQDVPEMETGPERGESNYYRPRTVDGLVINEDAGLYKSDLIKPKCPGMTALLRATLDYISSNFLPVDWVQELDIRDYVPVIPPNERIHELMDYFVDNLIPMKPICSVSFARMLKHDLCDPDTPHRLQKTVCASYIMSYVLRWSEYDQKPGDKVLSEQLFKNVWLVLTDPSIFITANFINCQTLMFAAIAAEFWKRPGLCWTLISQCCRLAQTLGLHRKSAYYFEQGLSQIEVEERRYLFWIVYTVEKTLALTFGRTSCLPAYDIDVEPTDFSGRMHFGYLSKELTETQVKRREFAIRKCQLSVALAGMFDEVYVKLYSAQALRQNVCDKRAAVRELDAKLRAVWSDTDSWISDAWELNHSAFKIMVWATEFMYHDCMTMIHRVSSRIPGNEGDDLVCTPDGPRRSSNIGLDSARKSLLVVYDMVNLQRINDRLCDMVGWCLICQPFAPFFELFSSVIRTGSQEDLRLMRLTTGVLERMDEQTENVKKLSNVADLFTKLATVVAIKLRETGKPDSVTGILNISVPEVPLSTTSAPAAAAAVPAQRQPTFDETDQELEAYILGNADGSGDLISRIMTNGADGLPFTYMDDAWFPLDPDRLSQYLDQNRSFITEPFEPAHYE
ncbi:hypothetical protein V1512DRAFT_203656 [Lipomyces arxii]|uniref:uncharacterized protein n=1 Tax=Lipomyces arxii TaxID=56418 RepID=UPI0034D00A6D